MMLNPERSNGAKGYSKINVLNEGGEGAVALAGDMGMFCIPTEAVAEDCRHSYKVAGR